MLIKNIIHLTRMRLSEQPVKMLYLVATLASGVLAWMVLSAFASPQMLSGAGDVIKASMTVSNARLNRGSFPLRYVPRIQQMPGVDRVRWANVTTFECADSSRRNVTVLGYGGVVDPALRRYGVSETDLIAWHAVENGVLAGPQTASQCGLMPGTSINPWNHRGNGQIPLHVIAVVPEQTGPVDQMVYAHYDYINRFMSDDRKDTVSHVTVSVRDPAMLDQVADRIEKEFQSSDPPLETRVFAETSILGRFGQVQALLLLIMGAMALCVFLVFCAVLVHLTAQRRASMAVLQTMGFTGRIQFCALLLEMICVVFLGAALGIAAGYGALALLTPWASSSLLSPALRPVDGAVLVLLPALLLLLIVALSWPAAQIEKLKPIDYLRL